MQLRINTFAIYLILSSKFVPKNNLFNSSTIMLLQNSDYQRLANLSIYKMTMQE
jgi:hypothetical protein